jgi:hypothetical protein
MNVLSKITESASTKEQYQHTAEKSYVGTAYNKQVCIAG